MGLDQTQGYVMLLLPIVTNSCLGLIGH
jgi:hypothetical protein